MPVPKPRRLLAECVLKVSGILPDAKTQDTAVLVAAVDRLPAVSASAP
jgi:hypothetical protein